jgi:hypothetical protein
LILSTDLMVVSVALVPAVALRLMQIFFGFLRKSCFTAGRAEIIRFSLILVA